jgi:hypothetical protein
MERIRYLWTTIIGILPDIPTLMTPISTNPSSGHRFHIYFCHVINYCVARVCFALGSQVRCIVLRLARLGRFNLSKLALTALGSQVPWPATYCYNKSF